MLGGGGSYGVDDPVTGSGWALLVMREDGIRSARGLGPGLVVAGVWLAMLFGTWGEAAAE